MSTAQVLIAAACVGLTATAIAYGLAWWAIGHEPLLSRNCNCRGRR